MLFSTRSPWAGWWYNTRCLNAFWSCPPCLCVQVEHRAGLAAAVALLRPVSSQPVSAETHSAISGVSRQRAPRRRLPAASAELLEVRPTCRVCRTSPCFTVWVMTRWVCANSDSGGSLERLMLLRQLQHLWLAAATTTRREKGNVKLWCFVSLMRRRSLWNPKYTNFSFRQRCSHWQLSSCCVASPSQQNDHTLNLHGLL